MNNFYAIIEQEDDVALPEVPIQPVPELPPEAAKADPGTAAVLHESFFFFLNLYIDIYTVYILNGAFPSFLL